MFSHHQLKSGLIATIVLFVSALLPALCYATLFYIMPGQLAAVLQDSLDRLWPFAFSIAVLWVYAVCHWAILRSRLKTKLVARLFAAAAMIIVIFGHALSTTHSLEVLLAGMIPIAAFWLAARDADIFNPASAATGGFALFVAFAALAALNPIAFPRAVGAFAIIAVFLGTLGIVLTLSIAYPRAGVGTLGIFTALTMLSAPNNHALPTVNKSGGTLSVHDAIEKWLDGRADLEAYRRAKLPYPVILVSSEGGGIYAAAHAYLALSTLASHCPTFAQHVFATVGVSGGAIGNALYASSINGQQSAQAPCSPADVKLDLAPIAADHLSPVLARFLLLEPVDRIIPGQWLSLDRASILTRSFLSASRDPQYLELPMTNSWDLKTSRPAVIAVTTSIQNGRRLILSPITPDWGQSTGDWWPGGPVERQVDLSLIEAASTSARFPWLTPTAMLKSDKTVSHILADGGYFENSGAETVIDIVNEFKAIANIQQKEIELVSDKNSVCPLVIHVNFLSKTNWKGCSRHIFLIHFAIASSCMTNLGQGCGEPELQNQSFLLDPMLTLLSIRSARGALALERSQTEMCGAGGGECLDPNASQGFFRTQISPAELELPLGWFMPSELGAKIAASAIPSNAFKYATNENDNDNDNDISRLIYHFDLSLYPLRIKKLLGGP